MRASDSTDRGLGVLRQHAIVVQLDIAVDVAEQEALVMHTALASQQWHLAPLHHRAGRVVQLHELTLGGTVLLALIHR